MKVTGRNLCLVLQAVKDAISEMRTQIGSCPDVVHYAADIEEYEESIKEYDALQIRIIKAIERESAKKAKMSCTLP